MTYRGRILSTFCECQAAGSVACRRESRQLARFKECHENSRLGRTKIFAVSRHVPSALDHLADQLVLSELKSDAVQGRPPLTSLPVQCMTVVALLHLENESALPLERGRVLQEFCRDGLATPSVHLRTPRGISGAMRVSGEHNGDKRDRENRNRAPAPTLLSFTGEEREKKQRTDNDDPADEQGRRLHRRRQEGQHRVQPQEEVIGTLRRLDDGRVRLTAWSERSEVRGARRNRQQNKCGEEEIFPDRVRDEGRAVLHGQLVVLDFVCRFLHEPVWHC